MKLTDILIQTVDVRFTKENLLPFHLSTGSLPHVTYASVRITVRNRKGQTAQGSGGIFLSQLWSFPGSSLTSEQKDAAMREIVLGMKDRLLSLDGFADPMQIFRWYEQQPFGTNHPAAVPKLAIAVCWSPFDAAVHDAWAKASSKSAYDMYNEHYLNEDLGSYFGEEWKGLYPDRFLEKRKRELPVQHVVGITDPLTRGEAGFGIEDEGGSFPLSMDEWIRRDGASRLKLKLKGTDLDWDLQRIVDSDRIARETLLRMGEEPDVTIALDPNTSCPHPDLLVELLDKIKERDERLFDSITYIEQPTARNLEEYTFTLHEVSRRKPVILDESLDSLDSLRFVEPLGWSGVALKTCKGQSSALLSYCWARHRNAFTTVQDLTNPGLAYVHSANLAGHLSLSSDAFECNSRQYAPNSCAEETALYPELFVARQGKISLNQIRGQGLY